MTPALRKMRPLLLAHALLLGACGDNQDPLPPYGPPGELINVANEEIPLGEDGRGGSAASGDGPNSSFEPGSLGMPCETDDDCRDPLTCYFDPENFIGHKQCTVRCTSTEACEAEFGEGAFCIGAEVCVRGCVRSEDCPGLTRCIDAHWCERSGPGSGVPFCSGTPLSCSLLSDMQCSRAIGCTDASTCSGFASSCYSRYSRFSCESQDGCFWSSYDEDCSGVARSCTTFIERFSCTDQSGCLWQPGCTGVAAACDDMPVALCQDQPGCTVVTE